MKMKITINNMMGVGDCEIGLVPGTVTAVIGRNMSGKTSVALAAAAVLARDPNPLDLPATKRGAYLRDGSDAGAAVLYGDDGEEVVRWDLKDGALTASTRPWKPATPASVGLVNFATLSGKSAIEMWESMLLPPTRELLKRIEAELEPALDPDDIKGVLATITSQGWESVDKVYGDRAKRAKAAWKGVTGLTYGSRNAADWLPIGWLSSYDGLHVDDCTERLRTANEGLTGLHVARALTGAEVKAAQKAAEALPGALEAIPRLVEAVDEAKETVAAARKSVEAIRVEGRAAKAELERYDQTKPSTGGHAMTCPACKASLMLTGNDLVNYDAAAAAVAMEVWKERRKAIYDSVANQAAIFKAAQRPLDAADEVLSAATSELSRAEVKVEALREEGLLADETATEDRTEEIEGKNRQIEDLRKQRDLVSKRAEAQSHHEQVQAYTLIATILGPKGVRAKAMEVGMEKMDSFLGIVATTTGWPRVEVDRSYNVSIGKRATLRMCSESERWRGQTALQIAISRLMRDSVVVLDRSDVLDTDARQELVALGAFLAERKDPPAIILCATPEKPPYGASWMSTQSKGLPVTIVNLSEGAK